MSEEIKKEPEVSKSKAKREARKAEAKAAKTKKNFDAILGWVIGIVIAAVIIGAIVGGIIQSANEVTSSSDYSDGITEEGYVDGANLKKVTDLDLDNLTVDYSEVEYSDDDVASDISDICSSLSYYDDDATLTVATGDTINLDYTGYIDGEAFDGGSATGATLEIGSGTFIDDFEDQLVGSHPGDAVTVEVTFPDDYTNNTDLAGKDATFECTVNSIQVVPELTDELVVENYGDYASTVDELKTYLKTTGYTSNLKTYISNYISENASVSKAPSSYVKHLMSVLKYTDEQNYEYYNQYYYQYLGSYLYSSFEDYTGMTDAEYNSSLKDEAKTQAALDMTYEAYFKAKGLTVTDEIYDTVVEIYGGEDNVSVYGEPFLRQVAIKYTVVNYLADNITVNGAPEE